MNIKEIKELYLKKMNYLTNELLLELEDIKFKQNDPIRILGKKDDKFEEDNILLNEISDINFSLWNDSNNIITEQLHRFLMTDKGKKFNEDFYKHHLNILKKIDIKINIIKENVLKQKAVFK